MKKFAPMFALCAMFAFAASMALAAKEEAKEVTLKGTALCGKCELKKDAKCNCILKVSEDGKDVLYYLSGKVDRSRAQQLGIIANELADKGNDAVAIFLDETSAWTDSYFKPGHQKTNRRLMFFATPTTTWFGNAE